MSAHPLSHHRRSIRLKRYDYAGAGAYFVTMCTYKRECLFGEIVDGKMVLNAFGKIMEAEWLQTQEIRPNIELDEYSIMPNHVHGIIIINETVGARHRLAPTDKTHGPESGSVGAIIGQFKSITRKQINRLRDTPCRPYGKLD